MSEEEDDEMLLPILRYRWYAKYDRFDEYDKNPEWANDIWVIEKTDEVLDGHVQKFYDKYDPEHVWVRSDTVYDLTNCL